MQSISRHDSLASAKRHKRSPLGNTKHKAEPKRQLLGEPSGSGEIVRSSPYVRRTAKEGSKRTACGISPVAPLSTHQEPSCSAILTLPRTETRTLEGVPRIATTFVRSVLSLCSKSIASCSDMSEPLPDEGMFLDLVSFCGVVEAKRWAEVLGLEHQQSYTLLSKLLFNC
jgi:hypothetical protein